MSRKRDHERALFECFVKVAPEFCGEPLDQWFQPSDEGEFPDIIGRSTKGRRIGIEIAEWLNEEEMRSSIEKERQEEQILAAIGDQGTNPTRHIEHVWLGPKPKIRVKARDAADFRAQLFGFILECDAQWPRQRCWKIGHRASGDDFRHYPVVATYLDWVHLWPADRGQWVERWIGFPARAGFFGRETMFKPLREIVADKIDRYGTRRTGFDDLTLLVIYNRALIHNSPAETPLYTFDDAVNELRVMIRDRRGPFDRVLLYIAVDSGRVLPVC